MHKCPNCGNNKFYAIVDTDISFNSDGEITYVEDQIVLYRMNIEDVLADNKIVTCNSCFSEFTFKELKESGD